MVTSHQLAPAGIALASCILLWRIFSRFRRAVGRQQVRLLRTRLAAYLLPVALLSLLFGVWAHPWTAAAQLAGMGLGVLAAGYSFRTSRLEVVDGAHFYTPNPYIGTAIVAAFVARVLYRLARLYGATSGFTESPAVILKNPLSAFIAGLMLGFYAWQAWQLLRWHKATTPAASAANGA